MAARRFAWVLNLDADLELAVRHGYTPKRTVLEAMKPYVARLASSLLGPEDVLVGESPPELAARSGEGRDRLVGRAFCPTPRAVALLRRARIEPEPHPDLEVLRRVNSRAFAASLGPTLPGATFVTDLEDALAKLAGRPPVGDGWRVKRNFGMTGRGQRVLPVPAAATSRARVDEADVAFVRAGLAEGGVQIEPNVRIETEYGIHGMLEPEGGFRLGAVVRQTCDARGSWLATERLTTPTERDQEVSAALVAEAGRVAVALAENGYHGPFGIDAYTYRGPDRQIGIQMRGEINARYSMGFSIGFEAGG